MIEVREVIRRWKAEHGLREMSRGIGLDRKTVRRYVEVLEELGVARDVELDDALVHEVGKRVQARTLPDASMEPAKMIAGKAGVVQPDRGRRHASMEPAKMIAGKLWTGALNRKGYGMLLQWSPRR